MIPGNPILVYDGPCTLCNRTVQWVYEKDLGGQILFTSLQSKWTKTHVPTALQKVDSVLFFDGTDWYAKSDAVLHLLRSLPRPWHSFFELRIIPRALRDVAYDLIARFRYQLFGKGHCALLPTDRVLD